MICFIYSANDQDPSKEVDGQNKGNENVRGRRHIEICVRLCIIRT